jgi:hypothetical protein
MQPAWWEDPIGWLCKYWWILLIILAMALGLFFTRDLWLPAIGLKNGSPSPTPAVSASPTALFRDPQNTYQLAYPANWIQQDAGNQAQQWILPEGVTMSVHAEPLQPGDTLENWAQEVVTRMPYDVISQTDSTIAGQPAIRQEVAYPGQTKRIAVGYLVLNNGQKYQIALSGLAQLQADEQERVIQEFEKTLVTFQFQP